MNRRLRVVKILVIATALATLLLGLYFYFGTSDPAAQGDADAARDLARGRLCLKTYGQPQLEETALLLKERFGVESDAVAGCQVSDDLVQYCKAYNRRMEDAIAARFGEQWWKGLNEEAAERYRKRKEAR